MNWNKYTHNEVKRIIFNNALEENTCYESAGILGLPGTYLDRETLYDDAAFLKVAPLLSTITNSNHIGCHTLNGNNLEEVFQPVFNFKYLPCT